jgi:hypothetical protein
VTAVVALVSGCGGSSDEGAKPPATASPPSASSPVATETPPPALPGPDEWVDGLTIGEPPAIGYVIGHTYHSPDGRLVPLFRDRGITSIVRLGDGYLVTSDRFFEGSTGVYGLDRDGRVDPSFGQPGHVRGAASVASYPVLSADRSTVHWLTFTPPETGLDLPTLLHAGDVATGDVTTVELDIGASFLTSVAGEVGDQVVVRTGWGGRADAWIYDGSPELARATALNRASIVSPRSRLVALRLGDNFAGGGVLDFATRDVLWRRPNTYPVAFSPSGRQLLIFDANQVAVVGARTGEVRSDVEAPGYRRAQWSYEGLAWEDERHLLAGVVLRHRAAVVRIDVRTGNVELAVDWTPTERSSYVAFETRS